MENSRWFNTKKPADMFDRAMMHEENADKERLEVACKFNPPTVAIIGEGFEIRLRPDEARQLAKSILEGCDIVERNAPESS